MQVNTDAPQVSETIKLKINDKELEGKKGQTILAVCKENKIPLPTMCYHPRLEPLGRCQLCLVEDLDNQDLLIGCAQEIREGMNLSTMSVNARNGRAKKTLLLQNTRAVNAAKVKEYYPANGEVMTNIPEEYQIQENTGIRVDPLKCIECGRCVGACSGVQNMNILEVVEGNRVSGAGKLRLTKLPCIGCGQCATVCPSGAVSQCDGIARVKELLANPDIITVVQTAPSVRVAIAEKFGCPPGQVTTGKMVAALRKLGFNYILDTNFGADLTIMEEAFEFYQRLLKHIKGDASANFPMFTSCCPAWVNFVEQEAPDFIKNLSSCRSPMSMLSPVTKTYFAEKMHIDPKSIANIAVMPCIAKKMEVRRPQLSAVVEGQPDTEEVITTNELAMMIKQAGINWAELEDEDFDHPFGASSGAAAIFGVTGGVMEAAIRTAYEYVTKKPFELLTYNKLPIHGLEGLKEATITIPLGTGGFTLRIAVCSGIKYARELVERIRKGTAPQYHFIEVMACPNGCICGGGQPDSLNPDIGKIRSQAIYSIDERSVVRLSHKNPEIIDLYKNHLGEQGGEKAHHLLHTHFNDRSKSYKRPSGSEANADADIGLVYATMKGSSKNIAEKMLEELKAKFAGKPIDMAAVSDVSLKWVKAHKYLIYVTPTYGAGLHPECAKQFIAEVTNAGEHCLDGVSFAVFGLGSSRFKLFCKSAKDSDELFEKCGGKRLCDVGLGDQVAPNGSFSVAYEPWIKALLEVL